MTLADQREELIGRLAAAGLRRSAVERFRYRLDVLSKLYDVEIAMEEATATLWYMSTCAECTAPPHQFSRNSDRSEWASKHVFETGHTVIKYEEPRA